MSSSVACVCVGIEKRIIIGKSRCGLRVEGRNELKVVRASARGDGDQSILSSENSQRNHVAELGSDEKRSTRIGRYGEKRGNKYVSIKRSYGRI